MLIFIFPYNTPVIEMYTFLHLAVDTNPGAKKRFSWIFKCKINVSINFTFCHN